MRRSTWVVVVAVLALPILLGAARRRGVTQPLSLDARRSFAITDHAVLDGFTFERVMLTLAERSGVPGLTGKKLFQQWLDTQNPKPGLVVPDAPHCDDFTVEGKAAFNGCPRRCPTPEGKFATIDPFGPRQFIPLAIINRFAMAASDASHCGQYRLIFARDTGRPAPQADVLHIIFEGVLPNPQPQMGLAACRPVAEFWANLSANGSIADRRAKLEEFFFNGLPGFAPVVHPDSYGSVSGGGVRTFHYTPSANGRPQFYQFRLEKGVMQPDVLQNMPMARFFDARNDSAIARRFRESFVNQIQTLAIADRNRYFMDVPHEFLIAESDPTDGEPQFLFVPSFLSGLATREGLEFNSKIEAELKRIGSPLKPLEMIYRAQSLNCFGCHSTGVVNIQLGPPPAFAFLQHVNEHFQEPGEAGRRYAISQTMREVFIPHRMEILRNFLASGAPPVRTNGLGGTATIGGGRAVQ